MTSRRAFLSALLATSVVASLPGALQGSPVYFWADGPACRI